MNRPFRGVVFLDRDGTLIEDATPLSQPDQVRLIAGAGSAVRLLNQNAFAVVLITNQAGVARALLTEQDLDAVHRTLRERLVESGAFLDHIQVCPHHPEATLEPYRQHCRCRKPGPGMVESARTELGLENLPSVVIGDGEPDLGLAEGLGIPAVLVLTGHGRDVLASRERAGRPVGTVKSDLAEAVDWLLSGQGISSLPV